MADKILPVIEDVIAMLPELDEDERLFVSDYREMLLARCKRYLSIAADVRDVEM
jgi:serine/threonine-protein kinase HipA